MHIQDIFRDHATTFSFEFFPPKSDEAAAELFVTIAQLQALRPSFVSVTYGAGGSTRERTHVTIERILATTDLVPAAHLTCVAASRGEISEVVHRYWDAGVRHQLAQACDNLGKPDLAAMWRDAAAACPPRNE